MYKSEFLVPSGCRKSFTQNKLIKLIIVVSISSDDSNGKTMKRRSSCSASASKSDCTVEMDSAVAKDASTILTLNDDCLLEVFQHFNVPDLCSVADVCSRFRQNAKYCFAHSKKDNLDITLDIGDHTGAFLPMRCIIAGRKSQRLIRETPTLKQALSRASRVLRNFGEFIVKFRDGAFFRGAIEWNAEWKKKYYTRQIIELLLRYSCGTLAEMDLSSYHFEDDFAPMMRPLVEHLHKLSLSYCKIDEEFLRLCLLWCEELRELYLSVVEVAWKRFDWLHQPFPKLVKISIVCVEYLEANDIVEMLKCNPQLKEIKICNPMPANEYKLLTIDSVLPPIAKYVPEIETLRLFLMRADISFCRETVECFSQLSKLTSLTLDLGRNRDVLDGIVSAINTIAAANIQLKFLQLHHVNCTHKADQFFRDICKFKQLEALVLAWCHGFTAYHLMEVFEHCSEISRLVFLVSVRLEPKHIIETVRLLPKLRLLRIGQTSRNHKKFKIDIYIFKQLLRIVENRREPIHLEIKLPESCYTQKVPIDLAEAHKKSLSIISTGKRYSEQYYEYDNNTMPNWI